MPRRSRRRITGKWEQIEQEDREEALRELERKLHRERHGRKPKPWQQEAEAEEPEDADGDDDNGTDGTNRDG